ncbi:MAG: patatin-like phospholipase family protein [Saprospiraceae bacterium]|nr:patatin-like phospholipase family protein [Saprospiraceae bacterium]
MSNKNTHGNKHIQILSALLGDTDTTLLHQVLENGRMVHIESGDILFAQGDTDKSLYIVLSGRLRAVAEREEGMYVLGDVTEGEPVGEFALFSNEPRSASVYAIRPSLLLEFNEIEYVRMTALQPTFARNLTSVLLKRLNRNNLQKHLQNQPKNIAVVHLQGNSDISDWTNSVEARFKETGVNFIVHQYDSLYEKDKDTFFSKLEEKEGLNFFVCNDSHPEWSKDCLLYSDLVMVASDFNASADIYPIEKKLDMYKQHFLNKKVYLLLLHPEKAPNPENTRRWFHHRKIDLHIHFRKNHAGDVARFCRILTNKAVGLVLGGGGSKGNAHIGAVKAMLHQGIQIDFLGGTSAGALYGFGIVFCDFDIPKMDYYSEDSAKKNLISNDYTFPILSIMSGNKMSSYLKYLYGHLHIEDFWITTYCISANYSMATLHIHETGLAWKKIMASIAIPGVFPPVVINNELHVDGGVVDNLPIEPMFRYPVGFIFAIALSGLTPHKTTLEELPSVGKLFWDKLLGRKKYKLPGISSVIINSLTLNSTQRQEQYKSSVSHYLELDLKGIGLLDHKKWRLIIQKGYDQMNDFLLKIPASEKFW